MRHRFQTALRAIYPPLCVSCDAQIFQAGLCADCWSNTPFIHGLVCDACGIALEGHVLSGSLCDDCAAMQRPWARGRAALMYQGTARAMVLRLKHADHHGVAIPAAEWMAKAAQPLLRPDTLIAPIPLHWKRFLKRRYNQSALLAQQLAKLLNLPLCPDLLLRTQETASLDGLTKSERYARLHNVMSLNPKHAQLIQDRPVLLVDDVMTSGATFSCATEVCLQSHASEVSVIALARVAKAP